VTQSRQMLGAFRREWRALAKKRNNADGGFASRPQGAPQMPQSRVAMLDKDLAIACALRLVLRHFRGSENVKQYETLH